ncbi:unnamed protein product [Moneuplotes crassus]|uniref:Uncharacterized protein n=1 Tax=Euplotes crassus TaxID=5936 RepID=A0AAD1XJB9_EUPCR|nr:unnamed protein product [Moneuplotes crassus]
MSTSNSHNNYLKILQKAQKRSRKNTLSFDGTSKIKKKGANILARSVNISQMPYQNVQGCHDGKEIKECQIKFPKISLATNHTNASKQESQNNGRKICINAKQSFMSKLNRATIKIKKGLMKQRFYKGIPNNSSKLWKPNKSQSRYAEDESCFNLLPSSMAKKSYLRNDAIPHKEQVYILLSSVIKNNCIDKFREKLGLGTTPYGKLISSEKEQKNPPKKSGSRIKLCKRNEFSDSILNSKKCLKAYKISRKKQRYSISDFRRSEDYDGWKI